MKISHTIEGPEGVWTEIQHGLGEIACEYCKMLSEHEQKTNYGRKPEKPE